MTGRYYFKVNATGTSHLCSSEQELELKSRVFGSLQELEEQLERSVSAFQSDFGEGCPAEIVRERQAADPILTVKLCPQGHPEIATHIFRVFRKEDDKGLQ